MKATNVAAVLALGLTAACGPRLEGENSGSEVLSISVANRRPISEVTNPTGAQTYAKSNNYYGYGAVQLKPGMKVMFSASYGSGGGEAGQSKGVLVEKNGGLYYKQLDNTTTQLLLPPGLAFNNGSSGESLWEMKSYLDLINRVAFAEGGQQRAAGQAPEVYSATNAALVDFDGGTAGSQVSYKDAMELKLEKQNTDSKSNVSVYFAKGVGAVALEFRETGAVGGTFKIYIGDKLPNG